MIITDSINLTHLPPICTRPSACVLLCLRCIAGNTLPGCRSDTACVAGPQGMTGYPLIDAAMKQLWSTGWAHNRARVVAGSFLVKQLLLPWQWGLKHFWDVQMDADLECDALGWQYISGEAQGAYLLR